MNVFDQSKLMELLYELKNIASADGAYVKASIYNYAQEYLARNYRIDPDYLRYLSKEEFITKMFDFSLAFHNILDIRYKITSKNYLNSSVEIEMNVYVEKTSDHTSNITVEMMEMFCKLPITTLSGVRTDII